MIAKSHRDEAIRAAVDQCLQGCYRAESPVFHLAECLSKLRDEGLPEADVKRVELTVLRLLVGLMADDKKSADDTDID
jgi:hypothetical protein